MAISPRSQTAVQQFAQSMGLPAVAARDGSYSFRFEQSGTLTFTFDGDGSRVLLSLAKHPGRLDDHAVMRLMRMAGPDITTGRFLHAGTTGGGAEVIFVIGLDDDEMSLPEIEVCVRNLLAAGRDFATS